MSDETAAKDELKLPQNKILWIIGGIVLLVAGWFSYKALISSVEDYKVSLVDAPKELEAQTTATFTWRVDGPPATISHTAVHMGTVSNPGELGKEIKPADTKYNEFVPDFTNGTFNIPLQFIGNILMKTEGKYYFRVHAQVGEKNYWSDEYTFDVLKSTVTGEHKITVIYPPKSVTLPVIPTDVKEATTGGLVNFTWRIDGSPTIINTTAIYYGLVSNPGLLADDVKPENTKYTDFVKDFIEGKFNIPLQFVGNTHIKNPGTYFYRAHALVAGKNIWSAEYSFKAQ